MRNDYAHTMHVELVQYSTNLTSRRVGYLRTTPGQVIVIRDEYRGEKVRIQRSSLVVGLI
jgi:hypothetical protein